MLWSIHLLGHKLKHRFIGKEQIDALKYFYLFVDGFQLKKVWSKMLLVWFDSYGIVTCQNIFAQLNSDIYRRICYKF